MSQVLESLLNNVVRNGYDAKSFKDASHEITKAMNLNARRLARAEEKVHEYRQEHARLIAELARVAGVAG